MAYKLRQSAVRDSSAGECRWSQPMLHRIGLNLDSKISTRSGFCQSSDLYLLV